MRLLLVFVALALLVLIPFAIWGDTLDSFFSQQATVDWLAGYGNWAWALGILLLAADLLIPLPATAVLAALGLLYGPWVGGLIGALGSIAAGILGYETCRSFGKETTRKLLGANDWERALQLDRKVGGLLVILSRWTPVLPEVVACTAGLIRMQRFKFYAALSLGSVPLGLTYAWAGYTGAAFPVLTLLLCALLPVLLWMIMRSILRQKQLI